MDMDGKDGAVEYSDEYMKGFNEAIAIAEEWVQLARAGEIDQDFRCIISWISGSSPGITPAMEVKRMYGD